jgi:3-oxocholest-4-en-26-oate---CoA ligase
MFDESYAALWEGVADALPNKVAVWHDGRATTYGALERRAAQLAAALAAAGVGAGDTVALYLYNSAAYVETLFAAFKLGAIPINVNYRYKERELAVLLDDAGAKALVFHASLGANVEAVLASGALCVAARAEDASTMTRDGGEPFEELIAAHQPAPRRRRSGTDQLFIYTGGTTGLPKGVVWRQQDLFAAQVGTTYRDVARSEPPADLASALRVVHQLAERGDAPRLLPVVPMMHSTGLLNTLGTLGLGGTVLLPGGHALDPPAVWGLAERQGATRMAIAGNAIARPLAVELERAGAAGRPYDLTSLRQVVSSGAAWTDDVKRVFLDHGIARLTEVIGSSEGGPYAIARVSSLADLPTRFTVAPRTRVIDDAGRDVAPGDGAVGMLAYGGPMPLGYHGDAAATGKVFRLLDGERHVVPGDVVTLAEDGTVTFLGRGAAVINTGGEKVFPSEVEEALLAHPGVADCAVVGVPDDRWGEVVTAVVEPAGGPVDRDELIAHVGGRLAGYKKPRHVLFVERLPRATTGKVDLQAIRAFATDAGSSGSR